MPVTAAPRCLASSMARTMLALTGGETLPPPTEKISRPSSARRREDCSQVENVPSQPSSLIRAVSSETLSVGQ